MISKQSDEAVKSFNPSVGLDDLPILYLAQLDIPPACRHLLFIDVIIREGNIEEIIAEEMHIGPDMLIDSRRCFQRKFDIGFIHILPHSLQKIGQIVTRSFCRLVQFGAFEIWWSDLFNAFSFIP